MSTRKKRPQDYPSFIFRISKSEKDMLIGEIEDVLMLVRKNQEDGSRLHNKNDVIIEALKIGLKEISKKKKLKD